MAAMSQAPVRVRAAVPGEGAMIAALWKQLWGAHERWGAYPGSRDPHVYAQLAERLDDDARVRSGHPLLGRHVHLVADFGDGPCGQVEGWLDRSDASSTLNCEVRSLIVDSRARQRGIGRALLDALARVARTASGDLPCALSAEVLLRNPAGGFYERIGFSPVAWTARIDTSKGATRHLPVDATENAQVVRGPAVARFVHPSTVVVDDSSGVLRGAAGFVVHVLEPPFVPVCRAIMSRVSLDQDSPVLPALARALVGMGCKLALSHGASRVEIADLPAPGTPVHEAILLAGAAPWSKIVARPV